MTRGDGVVLSNPATSMGMDFALDEEQREIAALADRVIADLASTEAVVAVEASEDRIDPRLWRVLAETGLLGLGIEERWGGVLSEARPATVELALVLQQQGRHVAPVPLWPTLMLGAHPIQGYADTGVQERWLPGVVTGEVLLTGAYWGVDVARRLAPVRARRDGERLRLSGQASAVPAGHVAHRILVPAPVGDRWCVALVDPRSAGVTLEAAATTDRSVQTHVSLDEACADELIWLTDADLRNVLDHARIGLCAQQLGVVEAALSITAEHVRNRRQFGREIGSFQAVAHRIADAYIDTEALRCTTLRAAWLLGEGLPATADVATASWWATQAGHRVLHSALHLHGGIGNDMEYPLHRHFLWARQIGLTLGAGRTIAELAELVPGLD